MSVYIFFGNVAVKVLYLLVCGLNIVGCSSSIPEKKSVMALFCSGDVFDAGVDALIGGLVGNGVGNGGTGEGANIWVSSKASEISKVYHL